MSVIERCDDCGNDVRSELYWHEVEGAWVCEEVPDCRERQFDQMAEQLRGAVEALQEIYDRHHMNGDGTAGQVSGDALRALGVDPDQGR